MLRFASSLTGDMHTENLRTALINYIISKQNKDDFIVIIEDIDKQNIVEGKDKEILEILELFGIEYSQVIYQSEHIRFHSAMALQLLHDKKAFSCFCSDNWLSKKHQEAKDSNNPYMYDDACANLPAELVIDNTNPFTIRIKKPLDSKDIDSFVIMNHDKVPTYTFSCAIDDMLSDISTVICSNTLSKETAKQEHIRKALSYPKTIKYVYLPSLEDDNYSVKALLEQGFLPEAILNYLISTLITLPEKLLTLEEFIDWFDLEKISDSPTRFDIDLLREINKTYLRALNPKELSRYVGFADEEIGLLAKLFLEDVSTTKELKAKIKPIFDPKVAPKEMEEELILVVNAIKKAPYFENFESFKQNIAQHSQLGDDTLMKTLRIILTGSEDGPDLSKIYHCIKNYIGEIVK